MTDSAEIDPPRVFIAMSSETFSNTCYLIAQPTRSGVSRVVGEIESILWDISTAAALILERHMPNLQAIVQKRAESKNENKH